MHSRRISLGLMVFACQMMVSASASGQLSLRWQSAGPVPGAGPLVTEVRESPADPDRLYASGNAGVVGSHDGGVTWSVVGAAHGPLNRVILSPNDPDVLLDWTFIATLRRSTDGGATWTEVHSGPGLNGAGAFAPSDEQRVYLATNTGFLRSDDGGRTFTELHSGYWTVGEVLVDFADADHLYLALGGLLYESIDGGLSFTTRALPVSYAQDLDLDPNDADRLLLGQADAFLSEDGGDSWQTLSTGAEWISCVGIDPLDGSRFLVNDVGVGMLRTDDAGSSWVTLVDPWLDRAGMEPSHLEWSHAVAGRVFLCGRAGLFVSEDHGDTWRRENDGLEGVASILGLADTPHRPRQLMAVSGGSIYRSLDRGLSWHESSGVPRSQAFDLIADPHHRDRWYVASRGKVYCSDSGGAHFALHSDLGTSSYSTIQMAAHPSIPNRLYLTANGSGAALHQSDDGGANWFPVGPASDWAWACAVSPVAPHRIYCTAFLGIFVSDDGGATWQTASSPPSSIVREIRPDPIDPNVAYCIDVGIWKTIDGGDTWAPLAAPFDLMHVFTAVPRFGAVVASRAQEFESVITFDDGARSWQLGMGLGKGAWEFLDSGGDLWAAMRGAGVRVLR